MFQNPWMRTLYFNLQILVKNKKLEQKLKTWEDTKSWKHKNILINEGKHNKN